jgi:tRNA pseudouridine55 synthase
MLLDADKTYRARIRLGVVTTTGDAEGEVLRTTVPIINAGLVAGALKRFRGEILQKPPMYSAIHYRGARLYQYARQGIEIEREPRKVFIRRLELVETGPDTLLIDVRCSKGTYIRTLAEDIGKRLNTGAHLTALQRTAAGKFTIAESHTLDQLANAVGPEEMIIPPSAAVSHLPEFPLTPERVEKTRNGLSTRVFDHAVTAGEFIRMTDPATGELIAIGRYDADENAIRPTVVLV